MTLLMKKNLSYAVLAIMVLASCTSNDYVGDQSQLENTEIIRSISFGMGTPGITRADKSGGDAATDLSNQFYVYAIKKESTDGAGNVGTGNLVFNNYVVKWVDNSYSTTSNTKGWEYVGYTLSAKEQANVTPNGAAVSQTIKYWDYGAPDYTFYAFSAQPADIEGDKVTVAKVQDQKTTDEPAHTVYDNGYTVTLAAGANLDKLFFAERINIAKSDNTDRSQANQYGGNVTFRFHNMATKVRVAMYETVPGYSVKIKEFKVADAANPAFSAMTTSKTDNFAANLQNCAKGTAGTMTVKYVETAGTTLNHPTVSFGGTKANILALGDQLKADVTIGESATGATYDKEAKAYTSVFPNETNAQNLKLKLSYTLTAPVTGEKIEITDKTAEIPAQYLQWKPGYAYTYIFKITDDNLYPITFDAVEVVDEDGQSEYITTVTEPSITTFGAVYNTTSTKYTSYQTGQNEYLAQTSPNQLDIFATFMNGSSVQVPSLTEATKANYVQIYSVTTSDATNFPITETSVAERLATTPSGTAKLTCTNITTDASTYFSAAPAAVTSVPAEDGKTKNIDALKLTGVKAGTYAIEIVTYDAGTVLTTEQSKVGYYSQADGVYTLQGEGNGDNTTTYYKQKKTYKVIKVVAP